MAKKGGSKKKLKMVGAADMASFGGKKKSEKSEKKKGYKR